MTWLAIKLLSGKLYHDLTSTLGVPIIQYGNYICHFCNI